MTALPDLKNFTLDKLTGFIHTLELPDYRARQILSWLYRPHIRSFEQMTDIKKDVRRLLAEKATFSHLVPSVTERSQDGTIKYGFTLHDGHMIESVLIPEQERLTLCVSSQVGCAMGCDFCLTGTMGIIRNLQTAEIVNQVSSVIELVQQEYGPDAGLNNLVFMGMGEPLANFDNLIDALNILMEERGHAFSTRRITVSTCGLVPRIVELGEKTGGVNLAISLHAADDETRDRLMPVNKKYKIKDVLEACRNYPIPKRKRIMFEYIMIDGVNDSDMDALQLADILKDIKCKINLLPCNAVDALPYQPSPQERVEAFQRILWQKGFTVMIRNSRGSDISAACGQLATNHQ